MKFKHKTDCFVAANIISFFSFLTIQVDLSLFQYNIFIDMLKDTIMSLLYKFFYISFIDGCHYSPFRQLLFIRCAKYRFFLKIPFNLVLTL